VRFAQRHAVCEIIGIDRLDEDMLYKNLAWLSEPPMATQNPPLVAT